ncbi:SapC family protein [Thioalkalivibrio denitrificans]|uniref:SapC family protein n=1 Tax=Thioalkalivibrio denitrificans TaxID=108003 RepID=A0A1V3NH66_9GAMM|nr:SapC family protein [Thioalkalivibrio denitrificans]OOG24218.1 SapC family protein [Thioalkalivibrio denitrificans]
MPQLMFYENVVPLNRETHRNLRLERAEGDCSFAAGTGFVPVAGVEFFQAARDYPVLISGKGDDLAPVALLGLSQGRNLFVDPSGRWSYGCHVPAFVRRYPFVLAKGKDDNFTVCIDDQYKGFQGDSGEPLFDADGKETPFLRDTIAFLQSFLTEMERTQAFMKRLRELDLLVARDMQLTDARGKSFLLKGFFVVDDTRLNALDDEVILEFHKAGYWPWIYAHLFSLGNLSRLQDREQVTG